MGLWKSYHFPGALKPGPHKSWWEGREKWRVSISGGMWGKLGEGDLWSRG